MDDQRGLKSTSRHTPCSAPSPSSTTSCHQDQISFLLGHLPPSASYPTCCAVGSVPHGVEQAPLLSCYPPPASAADEGTSAGEESLGAGDRSRVVRSLGSERGSLLLHGKRRTQAQEVDFEALDCESEDGVEVSEEPVKPAPARSSGSKRSRAAEVHNLSEKRRRSRINEKMKALQNLIPNSNKTDKASMLDEAIEYLKQLQLQVQMLSMRNGLNLHPMFLSGAIQPLQASQLCTGFSGDGGTAMNMAVGMLPLNQDSAAQNSFDLSNRCTPSHPSIIDPTVRDITNPQTPYGIESSHSHHRPFQLPVSAEGMLTVDMVARQPVSAGQAVRTLPVNVMKSMAESTTEHFSGQASPLIDTDFSGQASPLMDTDHLEECMLGRESSQEMLSKDQENQILVQHFRSLQTGRSFTSADVKDESPGF